jgi:hypothetical protein
MTALRFFEMHQRSIANRCTVSIHGRTLTVSSLWTDSHATYQAASASELRAIAGILEDAGVVVSRIAEVIG